MLAILVPVASATVFVQFPNISFNGTDYTWTYTASLNPGFRLTNQPTPCPNAPQGGVCQGLITIYDFAGYVTGSEFAPSGWTFVGAFTGPTPIGITSGTLVNGVDDSTLFNLAWLYTATTPISALTGSVALGNFGARSIYSNVVNTEYAVRDLQINTLNGQPVGRAINSAITGAPGAPQIPEPASVLGVGSGLLLLGFLSRRRQKPE